nr:LppA family lipoprotein [Mycobacterium lepraemurium]
MSPGRHPARDRAAPACGPYGQTDGKDYFLPHQVAVNVDVSEQDWAKIEESAKNAAAKIDATDVQVSDG